jgi:hypothetical protein
VDTGPVQHVRNLRHTLTHLRGELRTPQQFGQNSESGFPSIATRCRRLLRRPPVILVRTGQLRLRRSVRLGRDCCALARIRLR